MLVLSAAVLVIGIEKRREIRRARSRVGGITITRTRTSNAESEKQGDGEREKLRIGEFGIRN
jgi:hypothetical protein